MVTAVTLLSATLALGGFQAAGLGSNHQDIAPRYAGILFGITNATASIAGCAGIMGTGDNLVRRVVANYVTLPFDALILTICLQHVLFARRSSTTAQHQHLSGLSIVA